MTEALGDTVGDLKERSRCLIVSERTPYDDRVGHDLGSYADTMNGVWAEYAFEAFYPRALFGCLDRLG